MAAPLEYWFEYASTYSYLAAARIDQLCHSAKVEVIWRPFLLGPIFQAQGWSTSPFELYKAKGAYMWQDMRREARRLGIDYRRPSIFPQNGLRAARITCAAQDTAWLPDFVRAVYRANFYEDRDISEFSTLSEILAQLGQNPDPVFETANTPEIKQQLRANTEAAQASGIFGAPSFVSQGVLFWGNDRLEAAIDHAQNH